MIKVLILVILIFLENILYAHVPFEGMSIPVAGGGYASFRTHQEVVRGPARTLHYHAHGWDLSTYAFANVIYDKQGGPRGGTDLFSENSLFFGAQRSVGSSTLSFETEISLEPGTIGPCGYPLLFATGSTANGRTHLIDRMHPHTLFSELALSYFYKLQEKAAFFVYGGLPGNPALGPIAFHNYSGLYIPTLSITHHWLDSTHISFGVLTAGVLFNHFQLETSVFNGREPNQNYWKFQRPQLDSLAFRLSYHPDPSWGAQISVGHIHSPEIVEPCININRVTFSLCYNKEWDDAKSWYNTLAWGLNKKEPGPGLNALLAQSTFILHDKHVFFTREEWIETDELLPHHAEHTQRRRRHMHEHEHEDHEHEHQQHRHRERAATHAHREPVFHVGKASLGYMYKLPCGQHIQFGIGASGTFAFVPHALKPAYGNNPFSYLIFLRVETC